MNNTALRAEAQSANNTHMVFVNEEHEEFFYEKLEQAKSQDCHHKALIYVLGISEDTRKYFNQIYDIKTGNIKRECLHQGWLSSGGVVVIRLAFNLYTDTTPSANDYKSRDGQMRECRKYSVMLGIPFPCSGLLVPICLKIHSAALTLKPSLQLKCLTVKKYIPVLIRTK